MSQDEVASIAF